MRLGEPRRAFEPGDVRSDHAQMRPRHSAPCTETQYQWGARASSLSTFYSEAIFDLATILMDIPEFALSVRQPWAWAIIHSGKDIENRSESFIKMGYFRIKSIAIHAGKGMTREEYESGRKFIVDISGQCPRPQDLIYGGIIGFVTVLGNVTESESPWFVGPVGLVLDKPKPIQPFPATGQLGLFKWERGGVMWPPKPWMNDWIG